MLPALRVIEIRADKADFCTYIAQAYQQIGQTERADTFTALGDHLRSAV